MKAGEKYVIEIDKVFVTTFTSAGLKAPTLAKIKGFNSLVFDENGLSKLERLTDVAKDIRQEAYNLGFEQATKQLKEECNRTRREGFEEGKMVGYNEALLKTYHDGCEGCEYELCDGDPCTTCKGSYVDKYKPKAEKTVGIQKYDICKIGDGLEDEFCITRIYWFEGVQYFDAIAKDGTVVWQERIEDIERVGHIESLDKWLEGE